MIIRDVQTVFIVRGHATLQLQKSLSYATNWIRVANVRIGICACLFWNFSTTQSPWTSSLEMIHNISLQ